MASNPINIRMKSGRPFAFAGLWESWVGDGEGKIQSCTILTTDANNLVGEVHHRTPVTLPHEDYELRLDPDVWEPEGLLPLLAPYPDADMQAYPVSRRVNRPSNNTVRVA